MNQLPLLRYVAAVINAHLLPMITRMLLELQDKGDSPEAASRRQAAAMTRTAADLASIVAIEKLRAESKRLHDLLKRRPI